MKANRIVIVVKGGMVQDVYSEDENARVEILDLDTEEGMDAAEDFELPKHHVY